LFMSQSPMHTFIQTNHNNNESIKSNKSKDSIHSTHRKHRHRNRTNQSHHTQPDNSSNTSTNHQPETVTTNSISATKSNSILLPFLDASKLTKDITFTNQTQTTNLQGEIDLFEQRNYECFQRLEKIFDQAYQFLLTYRHNQPNSQPAIVFDIDDTVLYRGIMQGKRIVHAILPAVNFYKRVRDNLPKIKIFFLTARPVQVQTDKIQFHTTTDELEKVGINKYEQIFFFPEYIYNPKDNTGQQQFINAGNFKENIRTYLTEDLRYQILLNIGDQKRDHQGLHFLYQIYYQFNKQTMKLTDVYSTIQ